MLTLTLFRHAKSSWDEHALADVERPLNARGREAAPRMGQHMAGLKLTPDLILCSTAVRTRETAALALPQLAGASTPEYLEALYLASPATLLAITRRTPPAIRHLMLIGHNPGLHELALELARTGNSDDLRRLAEKLPTAGLVVIAFNDQSWTSLRPGTGRLVHFMTPRRLDESGRAPVA